MDGFRNTLFTIGRCPPSSVGFHGFTVKSAPSRTACPTRANGFLNTPFLDDLQTQRFSCVIRQKISDWANCPDWIGAHAPRSCQPRPRRTPGSFFQRTRGVCSFAIGRCDVRAPVEQPTRRLEVAVASGPMQRCPAMAASTSEHRAIRVKHLAQPVGLTHRGRGECVDPSPARSRWARSDR